METIKGEFNGIILEDLEGTVKWLISFDDNWIVYKGFVVGNDFEIEAKEGGEYSNDWILSSKKEAIKSVNVVKEKSSINERNEFKYRVEIRTGNNDLEIDPPFETRDKALKFYEEIMFWLNKK